LPCKAEFTNTDARVKECLHLKHIDEDLSLLDSSSPITIYHDNKDIIDWAALVSNEGTKHISIYENAVNEAHHQALSASNTYQASSIQVTSLQKRSKTMHIFITAMT